MFAEGIDTGDFVDVGGDGVVLRVIVLLGYGFKSVAVADGIIGVILIAHLLIRGAVCFGYDSEGNRYGYDHGEDDPDNL